MHQPRYVRSQFAILAAALALVLSGCGGGATTASSGGQRADVGTLDTIFEGTFQSPPTSAPPHDVGKSVYLISCGQSIPFCVTSITGAQDAADALGWKTTLIDSKGDFNNAGQAIRQAIAAEADGIFVYALDCEYFKQPLQEAKDAGIPVVTAEARDCNQDIRFKDNGGPQLFTSVVDYVEGSLLEWFKAYGVAQAKLALAKSGDNTHSMSFYIGELGASVVISDAYQQYLEENCAKCEDRVVNYTLAQAASGYQEKAQQALLQHPETNLIRVDADGTLTGGVLTAARISAPGAKIISGEGQEALLDVFRKGNTEIVGGVGTATTWEGWAAIDALLRIFAGEPPASSGIGVQVWDVDHNTPSSGGYEPPVDYRALYKKAWGVQ
jgi:ribose transport system substrate-binding protein